EFFTAVAGRTLPLPVENLSAARSRRRVVRSERWSWRGERELIGLQCWQRGRHQIRQGAAVGVVDGHGCSQRNQAWIGESALSTHLRDRDIAVPVRDRPDGLVLDVAI